MAALPPAAALKHATKSVFARQSAIYIDKGIIVLNKPPGLISQLHAHGRRNAQVKRTIGDLSYDFNQILDGLRKTFSLNEFPYPIHRLDKGTTGALTVARTLPMAQELSRQMQNKTVEKTYLALVRGGRKSFTHTSGTINAPIHYTDGRATLDESQESKPSITDWELIDSSPIVPLSLLRLRLHTGHKHQLRVHAAHYLNAPILGDTFYSKRSPSEDIRQLTEIPEDRIFLHASRISFLRYKPSGPNKRFRLGICAPLPEDFLKICIASRIKIPHAETAGGVSSDGELVHDGNVPDLDGHWVSGPGSRSAG